MLKLCLLLNLFVSKSFELFQIQFKTLVFLNILVSPLAVLRPVLSGKSGTERENISPMQARRNNHKGRLKVGRNMMVTFLGRDIGVQNHPNAWCGVGLVGGRTP